MRVPSRLRARLAVAAVLLLPALASTLAQAPSSAAALKTVTVSPDFSLVDGQQVIVRWSGFSKDGIVWIHICEQGATNVNRCASRSQTPDRKSDVVSSYSISNAKGSGSEVITVVVTDANHGLAGAPDVVCDHENPCDVVVNESQANLDKSVRRTIKFAPAAACPDPGELRAAGVGTDAAELALEEWSSTLCNKPFDIALGYTAKNDVSGRSDYQCNKVDFAVVEYLPDYENDSCPATTPGGKDFKRPATRLAPITISPVVIGFNMRDQLTGSRIDKLVLTPELLAEIFTGKLYYGQDPRIRALNPGVNLPVNFRAIARADQAGINYTLTRFLSTYAAKAYQAGGRLFQYGPLDSLANVNGLDLKTGGSYVAKAVLYPENDPRTTPWGFLGVMDASTAARYGLSTVTLKLQNNGVSRLVSPDSRATLAMLQGLKPDRYGYVALPARPANSEAWPMVNIAYVVPPAADASAVSRAGVAAVVQYALDEGQKSGVLPAGYVPLPEMLRASALKAIAPAMPDEVVENTPSTGPTAAPVASEAPSAIPKVDGEQGAPQAQPVTLASVFDRAPGSTTTTWLWFLLLAAGVGAALQLVRGTKGAGQ